MDLLKALDVLSTAPLKTESEADRQVKLKALRTIDEQLGSPALRGTADFPRLLAFSLHSLLRLLGDSDMNVWSLAEEVLHKVVKGLIRTHHDWIIVELYKGLKGQRFAGRSQRVSLALLGHVIGWTSRSRLKKLTAAIPKLIGQLISTAQQDSLLIEALALHFEPIMQHVAPYITGTQVLTLVDHCVLALIDSQGAVRRSGAGLIATLCRYWPSPALHYHVFGTLRQLLQRNEQSGEHDIHTMQGVLHCYLRLLRLQLEQHEHTAEYLLPELSFITALATDSLKHTDSNVVVSALELLQELLSSYLHVLIHVWTPERARDRFKALLDQFEVMLFEDSAVRISSQSLIVACCAHIFEHYWIDYAHLSRDHSAASSTVVTFEPLSMFLESKLTKWASLLTHSDPQLRGQAALFVAATQSAMLVCPRAPPGPEPLGAWAAQPLLQLILDDESSVAAKWGGQALARLWPALVSHAPPALPLSVLARILAVKSDAYLLVKIKVLSFLSRVDFRVIAALEEKIRHGNHVTQIGELSINQGTDLQKTALDVILQYLDDADHRVRRRAAKTLVKILPQLHAAPYLEGAQSRLQAHAVVLAEYLHGAPKSHSDKLNYLLWRIESSLNARESQQIKGVYEWCALLAAQGHVLPAQFIPIMLEHLSATNLATHLETQLHALTVMQHMVGELTGELAPYSVKILTHVLKVLAITTFIAQNKSATQVREVKSPEGLATPLLSEAIYLALWDRLRDTHRLAQASFTANLYDQIRAQALLALGATVHVLGKNAVPYCEELLLYLPAHLDEYPLEVLTCVRELFVCVFHPQNISNTIPQGNSSPNATTAQRRKKPTKLGLHEKLFRPELFRRNVKKNLNYATLDINSEEEWVLNVGTINSSTKTSANAKNTLKMFEPLVTLALARYHNSQHHVLKNAVLALLVAFLHLGVDFWALDRENKLLKEVLLDLEQARDQPSSELGEEVTRVNRVSQPATCVLPQVRLMHVLLITLLHPSRRQQTTATVQQLVALLAPAPQSAAAKSPIMKQPLMNLFATKPALPSPSQSWEDLKLFLALLGDLLLDHVRVYLPNKDMHQVINSILRTLFTVTLAEEDEDWHRDLRARLINLFTEILATDPSEHVIDHLRFILQLTKDKQQLNLTVAKQVYEAVLKLAAENSEALVQLEDVTALFALIDQLPKAAIDLNKLLTSLFLANLPTKLGQYELESEIERDNDKLFSELPPLNLPVPAVNLSNMTPVTPVTPVDISAALVETYVSEDKTSTPQGSPNKEGAGLLSPSTPLEASEITRDIQSPEPATESKYKSRDHQRHSYDKSMELMAQCHHTARLLTRRTRLCWIYSAVVLLRMTAKHEVRELTAVTSALGKELSRTLDLAQLCHALILESARLLSLYSHDNTSTRAVNLFLEQVTRLVERSKQSSSQLLLDMGSDSQLHLLVRTLLDQGSSRDRLVLTCLIEHAHLSTTGLLFAQLLLNLEAYDVLRYLFDHVRNKTQATWHAELLKTLLFLYQCKLIIHERYHPDKMKAMIDQLVNNEPYMETLAQNMHEEVVLQLVQSFTQPTWHDKLISFVNNRVSGAELSAVTCHHLLLLLISVPPKEHSLRVVFKVFMRHSHVSVKIAAENYIVSMLNEFHIDKNEASVTDSMIKLLIDEHRAHLRPSFVNRLKQFHWLQMETPALSRAAASINQGQTQNSNAAQSDLLISFDDLDHVPAEKPSTPGKTAEQSELIPSDMTAFIGNYLAKQLPHHVSNAKMIQWLTAVMHVDSHVFELMLDCKHCKLVHVTYCFQLNSCEHVKLQILHYLKRKVKELLDEQSHVTEWSELVDLTRVTMMAVERWGEEALEALVDSAALPDLVQTWIGRLTKLLTRAQHVTPTSTTTVMHVLRLAASIFKRSVFGIDHKLHVTRLSVTVPPVHGDTPTPDTAANNSTASHDVSRGLSELFVQLMNLYYTVFHPNRSMPVKITDFSLITTTDILPILEFFWRLLRDPTKSIFGSLALKFKYCHDQFLALLKEIAVKFDIPEHVPSPTTEPQEDPEAQNSPPDPRLPHNRTPFPFQVPEINFDHNDDPVTALTHFVRLINSLKVCHPRVVHQIWQQLYQVFAEKEENSQGSFATSQQLKALAVQGLTALLLRISYNWILPAPEEEVDPSLNLGVAKLREIYPIGRLTVSQLRQTKIYQWHDVDISLLIEELLMLYKHHLDHYLAHSAPHLTLHRAVIKSVLLLSDLFTRQQFLWMQQVFERIYYAGLPLDPTARSKDDTDHVLADDFLVDQYVLIGLCKAAAVLELPNSASQITSPNKDNKEPPGPVLTPNLVRRMSITFLGSNTNAPNLNLNKEGLVSGVVPWGLKLAALHGLNFAFQGYSYLKVTSVPPSVMALIDHLAQESIDHYVDDNNRVPSLLKMEQHHLTLFMNRLNLSVISANKSRDLRDSSSSSGSAASSPAPVHANKRLDLDADEEMMNMEVVKTMFAKIRTNKNVTKNALSNAAVEELARIQLPNLLLQKFSSDQIMSLVLAEFSKPIDTNLRLVAVALFKVFKALRKRKEQSVVVRWVVMCMGNFTQLSTFSNKSAQALWSLLVVMLAASRDRLWSALVWGLLADDDWLNTDLALLPVALADFVARQELEPSMRQLFLDALKDLRDPIVRNIEEQLAALPSLPPRRRHSRQSSANGGMTPKRRRDSKTDSNSSTPTKSRKKKDKEKSDKQQ